MILKSAMSVTNEPVTMEGAKDTSVRWLIADADGAPNFAMRMFEMQPGGHTPRHSHAFEHEVFIVEGEGVAVSEDGERAFRAGDVIYVPPDETHQFRNAGSVPCRFLCLIPLQSAGAR